MQIKEIIKKRSLLTRRGRVYNGTKRVARKKGRGKGRLLKWGKVLRSHKTKVIESSMSSAIAELEKRRQRENV